jgi:glycosyltransferase involved in cell wall biosynthesis
MDYVLVFHNIRFLHIYNAEEVIELAPRLKNLGIKVIYEAINIDHVLYARLAADNADVSNMKLQQTEAMSLADYVLCRSEIDEHHILEMGISSEKVSVYRGAIDTNNITYQTRTELRHKLVFLGHMYYPPNENALKLLADKVLPKLREIDSRYTITIIGIIAPSIRDEYLKKGILFRGGVDDLSKELLDYDIALCPLFEGSGTRLKVLDFFSSGLPVISTTLGIEGLHPQIQDCVVIEDDINQYAQVIHQLAMNLSSYAKIAQKGREYVESYYDWHNNLEPFLNLYRKS